jgi:hypothetical protein
MENCSFDQNILLFKFLELSNLDHLDFSSEM